VQHVDSRSTSQRAAGGSQRASGAAAALLLLGALRVARSDSLPPGGRGGRCWRGWAAGPLCARNVFSESSMPWTASMLPSTCVRDGMLTSCNDGSGFSAVRYKRWRC
jgi:hypothetical protein